MQFSKLHIGTVEVFGQEYTGYLESEHIENYNFLDVFPRKS